MVLYLFLKAQFTIPQIYIKNDHFAQKALLAFKEGEKRELGARTKLKAGRQVASKSGAKVREKKRKRDKKETIELI